MRHFRRTSVFLHSQHPFTPRQHLSTSSMSATFQCTSGIVHTTFSIILITTAFLWASLWDSVSESRKWKDLSGRLSPASKILNSSLYLPPWREVFHKWIKTGCIQFLTFVLCFVSFIVPVTFKSQLSMVSWAKIIFFIQLTLHTLMV